MNVRWPLTHAFLWGPMGRKAVPVLRNVFATATDPTAVSSAIWLLASAWDTSTLPRLREIARDRSHGARAAAVQALGAFGHPDDFELLRAGMADADPQVARAHVAASCAFGDLRAVTSLLPLTEHADEDLRVDALAALGVLATVDGLEAFAERADAVGGEHRAWLALGPQALHAGDVEWDAYRRLDRAQRTALLAKVHAEAAERCRPQPGDRALTRQQFERACEGWIAASRIRDEAHEWVEARHLIAVATLADVPLLLDLRGRLLRRLSDECLEEVDIVDLTLRWLVRSSYRVDPGTCERVAPVPTAARAPR